MDWKPIATAPRDGEVVDLWAHHGMRYVGAWWSASDARWHYGVGSTFSDEHFTHWLRIVGPDGQRPGQVPQ